MSAWAETTAAIARCWAACAASRSWVIAYLARVGKFAGLEGGLGIGELRLGALNAGLQAFQLPPESL